VPWSIAAQDTEQSSGDSDDGTDTSTETDGHTTEDGSGEDSGGEDVVVVEMTDSNEFTPQEVHVEVGQTVRWVNRRPDPRTRSRRTTRMPGPRTSRAAATTPATGCLPTTRG
jgi:hypothetical protein